MEGFINWDILLWIGVAVLRQLVEDYVWGFRSVALDMQISSWPISYFHETVIFSVLCCLSTIMFKWETSAGGSGGSALCAFVNALEGDFWAWGKLSLVPSLYYVLSIYVYIAEESTNSESILSATFHCCYLYRALVSMTVSKSQNSIPVSVVPQGGKNLLQFF